MAKPGRHRVAKVAIAFMVVVTLVLVALAVGLALTGSGDAGGSGGPDGTTACARAGPDSPAYASCDMASVRSPQRGTKVVADTSHANSNLLFVMVEKYGFTDLPEQNEFPRIEDLGLQATALVKIDASADDFYEVAAERILRNNPSMKFQFWYQPDVTKGSDASRAVNADALKRMLTARVAALNGDLKAKYNTSVTGLLFDWESLMDYNTLKEAIVPMRSEGVITYLAFSKGISQCASQTDAHYDFCLGQSYTNDTTDLYVTAPCRRVNTAAVVDTWKQHTQGVPATYPVPLFCAGGNCQGDGDLLQWKGTGACDIDERLDSCGIRDVCERLRGGGFLNMGVWYGNGTNGCLCGRCAAVP